MKHQFVTRAWLTLAAVVMAGASLIAVRAADSPVGETRQVTNAEKKPAPKLSGAELYSIHCARCHSERYPTERTAAQWKTIMLHMRVRANLPAEHARAILGVDQNLHRERRR